MWVSYILMWHTYIIQCGARVKEGGSIHRRWSVFWLRLLRGMARSIILQDVHCSSGWCRFTLKCPREKSTMPNNIGVTTHNTGPLRVDLRMVNSRRLSRSRRWVSHLFGTKYITCQSLALIYMDWIHCPDSGREALPGWSGTTRDLPLRGFQGYCLKILPTSEIQKHNSS